MRAAIFYLLSSTDHLVTLSPCQKWREIMDNISEWTDQLLEAEQQLAEAYRILAGLQADLKAAGRKKDTQAIGEVVERLARYGRLFEDIRQSWTEVPE